MTVTIRLFASFRETVGASTVSLQLGTAPRVSELLKKLRASYPKLGPSLDSALVAVNLEYVGPDFQLAEGDEVAIIPPVSGGAR